MISVVYVRKSSLNLIRDLISNQCSDLSRGLDSQSLLDLVTTRAMQLCRPTCGKLVLWGGGPGAVVKAAYLESWRSWVRTPLWPSSFKEIKCFFPADS